MVTMIALAVLTVLVVGAIRFTGTNRVAAVSKVRGDRMAACAETARPYLISRLRLFGISVTDLQLDPVNSTTWAKLPDDDNPAKQSIVGAGHYGTDLTITAPAIAIIPSASMGSASRQIRDLANAAPNSSTLGGTYYRVVMKCQEAGTLSTVTDGVARESELEFVFRYGL
jgi:hypothetical protein